MKRLLLETGQMMDYSLWLRARWPQCSKRCAFSLCPRCRVLLDFLRTFPSRTGQIDLSVPKRPQWPTPWVTLIIAKVVLCTPSSSLKKYDKSDAFLIIVVP